MYGAIKLSLINSELGGCSELIFHILTSKYHNTTYCCVAASLPRVNTRLLLLLSGSHTTLRFLAETRLTLNPVGSTGASRQ